MRHLMEKLEQGTRGREGKRKKQALAYLITCHALEHVQHTKLIIILLLLLLLVLHLGFGNRGGNVVAEMFGSNL
jgi:hypothetical protein